MRSPNHRPRIDPVRNDFNKVEEPLAVAQDDEATENIKVFFARPANDALGEQLLPWFLEKQVEKVASMTILLDDTRRADTLFDLEDVLAPNALCRRPWPHVEQHRNRTLNNTIY